MDAVLKNVFTHLSVTTLGIIIGANQFLPELLLIVAITMTTGLILLTLKLRNAPLISKVSRWNSLNESNTLFEASLFWCVLAIFSLLFLSYSCFELKSHSISEHSHIGEYFYHAFQKPAIIFGLSLPIIALIANHHRSLQTYKQIETAKENNYFNNHLQHLEQFKKYIYDRDLFSNRSAISIIPNKVHASIYSSSLDGDLKTGDTFNKKVKDFKARTEEVLMRAENVERSKEPKADLSDSITDIDDIIQLIDEMFSVKVIYNPFTITDPKELQATLFNIHRAFSQLLELSNFMFISDANKDLLGILSNIRKLKRAFTRLKSQNIFISS